MQRSDSKNTSRLVMQKDMIIESLRLELAEAQIKLVEMENMGGNHMQELEKQLLETRMANARLMEDNESFQLLLGEKSLNGDIMKTDLIQGTPHSGPGLSSLAEELESAEGESERIRKLEHDLKSITEEKKALALYIEKIISRVLQHDNFEKILDQKPANMGPPVPPPKDDTIMPERPSVIQRAMSVVGPRKRPMSQLITGTAAANLQQEIAASSKTRPQSQSFMPPIPHTPTPHEDPALAPSIPLSRTMSTTRSTQRHRRTHSSQSNNNNNNENTAATAVINQMNPIHPFTADETPHTPVSPGSTTTIPRANYFNGTAIRDASFSSTSAAAGISTAAATPPRTTSSSILAKRSSSSAQPPQQQQPINRDSSSTHSHDHPSPPRNAAGNTVFTGAVMTQHKLRPLRLVQQKKDDDIERRKQEAQAEEETAAAIARKKGNRGSWMPGWFQRGGPGEGAGSGNGNGNGME